MHYCTFNFVFPQITPKLPSQCIICTWNDRPQTVPKKKKAPKPQNSPASSSLPPLTKPKTQFHLNCPATHKIWKGGTCNDRNTTNLSWKGGTFRTNHAQTSFYPHTPPPKFPTHTKFQSQIPHPHTHPHPAMATDERRSDERKSRERPHVDDGRTSTTAARSTAEFPPPPDPCSLFHGFFLACLGFARAG